MQEQTFSKFCPNCGAQIDNRYTNYPQCGTSQPQAAFNNSQQYQQQRASDDSRWLTAFLLCWFLGFIGAHRFYTGSTGIGLIQLFTVGGCGIWWLIDFIMILTNNYRDSNGRTLK